ncbi:ArsR/SmtB family transcription factor [Microbacterium sp. RD1]|uniref:ArsR/SmtB family transcription factor n=1 Tax=Microbacterium sp. RD1 TaxID=3457313 RepID=UPI003FA57500
MANDTDEIGAIFLALSDPTRRRVVQRLGRGPATVGELAAPSDMALPSFLKHVRALEATGLIRTRKTGRARMCELDRSRLSLVDDWLADQRALWESRTDRLEEFVTRAEEPS